MADAGLQDIWGEQIYGCHVVKQINDTLYLFKEKFFQTDSICWSAVFKKCGGITLDANKIEAMKPIVFIFGRPENLCRRQSVVVIWLSAVYSAGTI